MGVQEQVQRRRKRMAAKETDNQKRIKREKNFKSEISRKYDVYNLWRHFLAGYVKNVPYQHKTTKNNSADKNLEAYIIMKFFPLDIFAVEKSMVSEMEECRLPANGGSVPDREKFIELCRKYILSSATNCDFIKHGAYDNQTLGDSIRKRYSELIQDSDKREKEINRIQDSLISLQVSQGHISEIVNEYFLGEIENHHEYGEKSRYFQDIDKIGVRPKHSKDSYGKVIHEKISRNKNDIYKIFARLIICLGLGEKVLNGENECNFYDVLFHIDNIKTPEDYYRLQADDCFEQKDDLNLYHAINSIDNHFFKDIKKAAKGQSKDFYYVGYLYNNGLKKNEVNIEQNTELASKAFELCLKRFTQEQYQNKNMCFVGESLYQLICHEKYPYNDSDIVSKFGEDEYSVLQKAIAFGCEDAAFLLGRKYEFGDVKLGIQKNLEKAIEIYCSSMKTRTAAIRCIRNLINENQDNYYKYEKYIRESANLYVDNAIALLNEYGRTREANENRKRKKNTDGIFLVIGDNDENRCFVQSLKPHCKIYIFRENIHSMNNSIDIQNNHHAHYVGIESFEETIGNIVPFFGNNILEKLTSADIQESVRSSLGEKLYFVALGTNQQKNLYYVTEFIDLCLKRHLLLKNYIQNERAAHEELIIDYLRNNVRIAVNVDKSEGEIYIDRIQSKVKEAVIPIRYASYYEEASYDLLWDKAPLFTSKLNTSDIGNKNNFVILTDTIDVLPIINNILSVMYYGDSQQIYNISIIGPKADKIYSYMKIYESALFEERDEVYDRLNKIEYKTVDFDDYRLWDWENKDKETAEDYKQAIDAIGQSGYIVCCLAGGAENIKLAELIREKQVRKLTRSYNPNYNNLGQIACLCGNDNLMEKTRGFFAGNEYIKYPWHSSFNLVGFGNKKEIYSFENIFESFLEKLAYKMHEAYYKNSQTGETDVLSAMRSYYSSQYDMDSSKVNALYTIYHMYTAGIFSDVKFWTENYVSKISGKELKLLETNLNSNLDFYSKNQHSQWIVYMKTRGFSCAAIDQVRNYMGHGNEKHNSIKVAKLHPYMVQWERLGDTSSEFSRKWSQLVDKMKKEMKGLKEECKKEVIGNEKMSKWMDSGAVKNELCKLKADTEKISSIKRININEAVDEISELYKRFINEKKERMTHDDDIVLLEDLIQAVGRIVKLTEYSKLEEYEERINIYLEGNASFGQDILLMAELNKNIAEISESISKIESFKRNNKKISEDKGLEGLSKEEQIKRIKENRQKNKGVILTSLYDDLLSSYVVKCKSFFGYCIEILERLQVHSNKEATGLQREMDRVMEELNAPLIGSIKDNDRNMIRAIPDNYREALRSIEYESREGVLL